MGKKINFNQEQLSEIRELYTNKNLSAESISKIFNCSKPRMFQELRRNNIDTSRKTFSGELSENSKEDIINLYIKDNLSMTEIGKKYGTSKNPIRIFLKERGIPIKSTSEVKTGKPNPKCSETRKRLFKEGKLIHPNLGKRNHNLDSRDKEIIKLYLEGELPVKNGIDKIVHLGHTRITEILEQNNIPVRENIAQLTSLRLSTAMKGKDFYNEPKRCEKISRAHMGKTKSESHKKNLSESKKLLYSLGILTPPNLGRKFSKEHIEHLSRPKSFEQRRKQSAGKQGIPLEKWEKFTKNEDYDFRWVNSLKNVIRKRDNQICMNCGVHREKLNESLQVHHVNYDKQLSIPENLISLCRKCHNFTNLNRPYWTKLFQDKLTKVYSYKYSGEGKVILNFTEAINGIQTIT